MSRLFFRCRSQRKPQKVVWVNQELKKNTHELQDKISKLSDQTDATIFKIKNLVNEI